MLPALHGMRLDRGWCSRLAPPGLEGGDNGAGFRTRLVCAFGECHLGFGRFLKVVRNWIEDHQPFVTEPRLDQRACYTLYHRISIHRLWLGGRDGVEKGSANVCHEVGDTSAIVNLS